MCIFDKIVTITLENRQIICGLLALFIWWSMIREGVGNLK
jgi:hypothetical protein